MNRYIGDFAPAEQADIHEVATSIETLGVGTTDRHVKGTGKRHPYRHALSRLLGYPIDYGIDYDLDTGRPFAWFSRKEGI